MRTVRVLSSVAFPYALVSFTTAVVSAQLPAFPGADGAGQFATGGRGGIVYHVTKLNLALDDPARYDPGTFLYGLNDTNFPPGVPRTIVFDVAGVFHLGHLDQTNWQSDGNAWDSNSRQSISGTNITIAGQTAPGPVIFMGGTLKPSGSNIIIRNITIAAGFGMKDFWEPPPKTPPSPGALPTSYTMDAMDITGVNILIDHVDGLYCSDEIISCNERADKLTIQYCNCSQAQNYNGHAYGHLLQAGTDQKISFLHNLDAHDTTRLPRVGSEVGLGPLNDFRDNVFYNWADDFGFAGYTGAFQSPSQFSKNNFIQNFYLAGNGGEKSTNGTVGGGTGIFYGYQSYGSPTGPVYTAVYAAGNVADLDKNGNPNEPIPVDDRYLDSVMQPAAYDVDIGVTSAARDSFTNVLRYAGSRWWERDYDITDDSTNTINTPDERIIYEVITGTGKIMSWADDPFNNDPNEGTEWRSLWALRPDTNGIAPFNRPANWDTDGDGMPDYWEIEHALDPDVPNNNGDFDHDGYTDLEEYLNEIAAWPAPGEINFVGQNHRYAEEFNWRVTGVNVNIAGMGNVPTYSYWQPSRFDTAVVSNDTVVVDAVGQHAGTLRLAGTAALDVTNGWLKIANELDIGYGSAATVERTGALNITSNLVNNGMLRLKGNAGLNVSGTLTNNGILDIMSWTGTLPAGFVNSGTILDSSLVSVESPRVNGSEFQVTIQGYAGHTYQLQYRNNLTSGSWQNVADTVAGTNAPLTLTDPGGAAAQQRFYRVALDQ
jgi:hypothetical protein